MAAAKHTEQLEWERRLSVPVAVAAMLAGVLMVQTLFVQAALYDSRDGVDRAANFLISFDAHPGAFIASAIGEAIGVCALGVVLFYLFRATRYRSPELPEIFKWLAIIGPILFAAASVYTAIKTKGAADTFTASGVVAGDAGKDRAEDLVRDFGVVSLALNYAGHLSIAFLYVMISVRAMRAGLLSRFMGILGVIIGGLLVLPIVPQPLVQLFWLGAFAALVLDRWPNGRGPAWSTGEATPWPKPERGAALGQRSETEPEPEAVIERPASRKRKRKRG